MKKYFSLTLILQLIAGILFGFASSGENPLFCAIAVMFVGFSLVFTLKKSKSPAIDYFIFGLSFYATSQYWIADTINFFGGFPLLISYLLLALYVLLSSLQFVFCVWIFKNLKLPLLVRTRIAFPLSWFMADFLFPKMFPWSLIHPLISFKYFSILASTFGCGILTLIFLWLMNLGLTLLTNKEGRKSAALIFICLLISLSYLSFNLVNQTDQALQNSAKIKVALVQANIDAKDIINSGLLTNNLNLYKSLSRDALLDNSNKIELLVWPESSANFWTPANIENIENTKYDPFAERVVPHVYGGLSFAEKLGSNFVSTEDKYAKYNTAFVVDAQGKVLGKYHKQILMPFGEYLPFAKTFPILKNLSPETGDLDQGELIEPILIAVNDKKFRLGILICYEDLVSGLFATNALNGANILVNLTNDAWYGDSPAAVQHNLLASWGAIESSRFLLRATNTGLTAIINPFGEMSEKLPRLEQGVLLGEVSILEGQTFYVKYGRIFTWSILGAVVSILLYTITILRGSDVSKK
ncbi:MAG: apolipoprotein N-acyltransferase [Proteobacteria bacterium]|nr:apolipoprotein N-acyltransferase [Pseudomonadota bacterium]